MHVNTYYIPRGKIVFPEVHCKLKKLSTQWYVAADPRPGLWCKKLRFIFALTLVLVRRNDPEIKTTITPIW